MKWMDLSAYGAELKKVELANNATFPALVITDIEKYKQSGAVPLDVLKSEQNPTTFVALPGGRTGRAFNTPVFLLPPVLKDGEPTFKIRDGLSKILNISEDAVSALSAEMPEEQITLKNAYMDFSQFNALVESSAQQFYGTTLYLLKNKEEPTNLLEYKEQISNTQHSLFPIGNIANIPFTSLDKFGINSSIFDRAFLNQEDAHKAGYSLNDLKTVRLQGDAAILPVSLNTDNSVNIISDMNSVTQLAYSNFEWKKNFGIIQDYNSLLAVRELTRDVLNARLSNVLNRDEMEAHITKMAITLQNVNELNNVSKTHKTIKFNNKGVATLLMKNKNGEWRFIEKNGPDRIDENLNHTNYQKVIEKISIANHVIVSALALNLVDELQRAQNMEKVVTRHAALFKQYVKPVNDPGFSPDKHIGFNANGPRVHKTYLDSEIRKFEPDVGGELYGRQVENLLSELSELNDANDIGNIVGGTFNDEKSLTDSLKVFKAPAASPVVNEPENDEPSHDILSVAGFYDGSLKSSMDNAGITRTQMGEIQAASEKSVFQKDFKVLPKGISPAIDQNYEEASNVYSALQHITLSVAPWLNKELDKLKNQKTKLFDEMTIQHISQLSGKETTISSDELNKADDLIRNIEAKIEIEKIKENILSYQLSRLIPNDANSPVGGYAAFDSDAEGNYVPFSSSTMYLLTTASLKNEFEKENALKNGPSEIDNPVLIRVNDFVETQYKRIAMPIKSISAEIAAASDAILSINYSFTDIDFNVRTLAQAALTKDDAVNEYTRIYEVIAKGVDDFKSYENSSLYDCNPLDTALMDISRLSERYKNNTYDSVSLIGNKYVDEVLRQYESFIYGSSEIGFDDQQRFVNPGTSIKLTDMEKLETLREIYTVTMNELRKHGQEDVIEQHLQTGQDFASAYTKAQEAVLDQSAADYHRDLAGKFLVSYQSGNIDDKGLKSTDSTYTYSLNGDQPYRIKNVSKEDALPAGQIRLSSSSYNEAVKDAFTVFQINSVAAEYGIKPVEVQLITALADALREKDLGRVELLSEDALGFALSEQDFKAFSHQQSAVLDSSGNRPVIVTTPGYGAMEVEPSAAKEMIAKVALINQLAGFKSNFEVDGLIQGVGNLSHFTAVHKYLTPDTVESEVLSDIHRGGNYSEKAYSKEAAEFAYIKASGRQATEAGVSITGKDIHIIMNQPETAKDLAVARIIPAEWNIPVIAEDRLRSFDVVSVSSPDEVKELLGGVVESIMEYGVNGAPIKPKFAEASKGIPEMPTPLSELQDAVINKGQALLVRDRAENDEYLDFYAKYAAAALTEAFANLPDSVREHVDLQLAGEIKHSLPINMFVEETAGIQLPRVRFLTEDAEYPAGFKLADQISSGIIIRMVDPREERVPAFKLNEYDGTTNLPGNIQIDGLRAFSSVMERAGFNVKEYEAAVISETVNQDKAAVYKLVFGDEYLKPNEIAEIYGQYLQAELLDIQNHYPEETEASVRLSNEPTKQYLIVSPGVTADPLALKVSVNATAEDCKNSMMLMHSLIGQRTAIDIVNSIKPVQIKQGGVTEASLAVIAANFREQAKILSGTNFVDSKLDYALKSAPVWAKNDGENILITLAGSKEKATALIQDGMVALYDNQYNIETHSSVNALQLSILNLSRDGMDTFRFAGRLNGLEVTKTDNQQAPTFTVGDLVAGRLSNLVVSKNDNQQAPTFTVGDLLKAQLPQSPVVEVTAEPVKEITNTKQLIGDLIKEAMADTSNKPSDSLTLNGAFVHGEDAAMQSVKETLTVSRAEDSLQKTEYAEKLDKFPSAELNDLTGVNLRARIVTARVWPIADVSEHAASGHQQMDTLVLSRMIRSNIDNIPYLGEDEDRLRNAKQHYFEVQEMHGAVSKSQNTEELLANFREAHRNITKLKPDYLDDHRNGHSSNRQVLTTALLKAASLNESGMNVVDSFKEAARDVPAFRSLYSNAVLKIAEAEKLTGNERSFAFALNGYAINPNQPNFAEVNQALLNRFKDDRLPGGVDLTDVTNSNQSGVLPETLGEIQALNKKDFDPVVFRGDLEAKWGIKYYVSPYERQFSQGYGAIIDKVLTGIYEKFNGTVPQDKIGLGLDIEASSKGANAISDAIRLFGVDELSEKKFKEGWISKTLDKALNAEYEQMSKSDKSLFSGVQETGNNMITMVVDHGYQPKTEGLKALVDIYQHLKDGFEGVEPPAASESLVSQSKIDFTNKLSDFRNVCDQPDFEEAGRFARFFHIEMQNKQDLIFKTIEDRLIKNVNASKESGDLYPFTSVESNLQKVFNISAANSKSFVNKHLEVDYPGIDKAEKESKAFELQNSIENNVGISLAIDSLEHRAAMQMVELLDKYAPESIRNTDDFTKQVKSFFPVISEYISDNSLVDQYQTPFARKFVDFEERQNATYKHDFGNDHTGLSKDAMVFHFAGIALDNEDPAGLTLTEAEVPHAAKLLANLTSAVAEDMEKTQPAPEKAFVAKKDVDNAPEI